MTEAQQRMARALAQVVMTPGIATKRFARDMRDRADNRPDLPLTEPQAKYLREAVIRYRRSIPEEVVQLAREEINAAVRIEAAPC